MQIRPAQTQTPGFTVFPSQTEPQAMPIDLEPTIHVTPPKGVSTVFNIPNLISSSSLSDGSWFYPEHLRGSDMPNSRLRSLVEILSHQNISETLGQPPELKLLYSKDIELLVFDLIEKQKFVASLPLDSSTNSRQGLAAGGHLDLLPISQTSSHSKQEHFETNSMQQSNVFSHLSQQVQQSPVRTPQQQAASGKKAQTPDQRKHEYSDKKKGDKKKAYGPVARFAVILRTLAKQLENLG